MREHLTIGYMFALLGTAFLAGPVAGQEAVSLKERSTLKGHT